MRIYKDDIFEHAPKFLLPLVAIVFVLLLLDEPIAACIVLGITFLLIFVVLVISSYSLKQATSRTIVALGILIIGCGIGNMFTASAEAGTLMSLFGLAYIGWAFVRSMIPTESKAGSIVSLVFAVLIAALMVALTIHAIINPDAVGGSGSSVGNCFNCGGDGWDSYNGGSCIWCGGDGYSSWNP